MIVGKSVIRLNETVSTNDFLAQLMKNNPVEEGMVVWANYQTGGKGEGGSTWESKRGENLTISVLLTPVFLSPVRQFTLLKAIALGVKDFVSLYTDTVFVKWPNDIYVGTDKIAGILIENSFIGDRFENSLVGVGFNVNQVYFSKDIPNPVSLKILLKKNLDLNECFNLLCNALNSRYLMLGKKKFAELDEDYHNSLYKREQKTTFHTLERSFEATISGVEESGKLILLLKDKTLKSFGFKEIKY